MDKITPYTIKTKHGFKSALIIRASGQRVVFETVFLHRKDAQEEAEKQRQDFIERNIF